MCTYTTELFEINLILHLTLCIALWAVAVEYTSGFSAEG